MNGQTYTSDDIGAVVSSTHRRIALEQLEAWPLGKRFEAFYDAEDPRKATTDPQASRWFSAFNLALISGISFLILGIFEFAHYRGHRRGRRAEADGRQREAERQARSSKKRASLR